MASSRTLAQSGGRGSDAEFPHSLMMLLRASRPNLDGRPIRHCRPYFVHLFIGHGNTAIRPILESMP